MSKKKNISDLVERLCLKAIHEDYPLSDLLLIVEATYDYYKGFGKEHNNAV